MERRWSVPIISTLVALLALVLVAPELDPVTGAIPNKSGAYSACLTKSTGAVKVINYPKVKCDSGQRLIKWNAKGPAGVQGPQGPQGAQGPAGPADWGAIANKPGGFADGVDHEGVTAVRLMTVTSTTPAVLTSGQFVTDTADCPAGFLAVGGGHVISKPPIDYLDIFIVESRASDADTWLVEAYNSDIGSVQMRAQVNCLRAEPGGLVIAAKKSTFGPSRPKGHKPKQR